MKCNQCGTQFEGKFCPNCGVPAMAEAAAINAAPVTGEKKKKSIFKKWWFWVIAAVVVIGIIGGSGDGEIGSETASNKVTVTDFSTMSKADIENWAATNKVTVEFSEDYSDTVASGSVISQNKKANETVKEGTTIKVVISKGKKPSIEYQNALKKAESYSKLMHMSKQSIYDQLTSEYGEKFPADAAQYAIDNLNVDYKANALEKADSYSKTMYMSKQGIYDQLTSEYGEKFTAEEAQYAVDNLKADYKANALEKAKSYQKTMSMSASAIYDQLISEYGEQFTAEEAQYAIDHLDD